MCGIFGYIGNKINLEKIKILGVSNDKRGGDGTGVYSTLFNSNEEQLLKTVNLRTPSEFFSKEKKFLRGNVFIGHTRKSTNKFLSDTHPFKYGHIVGVHNGNVLNITELEKKYNTNVNIDSEIFFFVLNKYGINEFKKLLIDYKGYAALVAYDKKSERLILWNGASEKYNNKIITERSLYYTVEDDGIYFCTLEQPLQIISDNEVVEVEYNHLYFIDKNMKIKKEKIDRKIEEKISNYDDFFFEYPFDVEDFFSPEKEGIYWYKGYIQEYKNNSWKKYTGKIKNKNYYITCVDGVIVLNKPEGNIKKVLFYGNPSPDNLFAVFEKDGLEKRVRAYNLYSIYVVNRDLDIVFENTKVKVKNKNDDNIMSVSDLKRLKSKLTPFQYAKKCYEFFEIDSYIYEEEYLFDILYDLDVDPEVVGLVYKLVKNL